MKRKEKVQPKHMTYFDLLEALTSRECPICHLTTQGIERFFDALLYENVNNSGVREQFQKNFGYCNYHAHKFAGYQDGMAIALTHRGLLVEILQSMKTPRKLQALVTRTSQYCDVCAFSSDLEQRYLAVMMKHVDDEQLREHFLGSEGLCFPHYQVVLREYNTRVPGWMSRFQEKKYTELLSVVERFLESCNFTSQEQRQELTREESLSWQKLVRTICSYDGRPSHHLV